MRDKNKVPDAKDLLKDAYRYISEYVMLLEYHDDYFTVDKTKIDKLKKLKQDINNTI